VVAAQAPHATCSLLYAPVYSHRNGADLWRSFCHRFMRTDLPLLRTIHMVLQHFSPLQQRRRFNKSYLRRFATRQQFAVQHLCHYLHAQQCAAPQHQHRKQVSSGKVTFHTPALPPVLPIRGIAMRSSQGILHRNRCCSADMHTPTRPAGAVFGEAHNGW
jgi:hypothetical protein